MPISIAIHAHATGHNCCQAVLHAFGADADHIAASKVLGGGRAPGGRCGALHAADQLVDATHQATIESAFILRAGSVACREIRSLKKASCRDCVAEAARLVLDFRG